MKKKIVSALLTATMVCGMSVVPAVGVAAADDTITVGFSQVGAESDWRTANTESMKSTFSEENGYELNLRRCTAETGKPVNSNP